VNPPKKIKFIRNFAVEFIDRPGRPVFAVERFVDENNGQGFHKYSNNLGFVDPSRLTPHNFSAYSFYASHGDIMVVDIQGVGYLFTDPQVHSTDERFGDGDLGVRGMALFFLSFCHSKLSEQLRMPIFPLSRNELNRQRRLARTAVNRREDYYAQTKTEKTSHIEKSSSSDEIQDTVPGKQIPSLGLPFLSDDDLAEIATSLENALFDPYFEYEVNASAKSRIKLSDRRHLEPDDTTKRRLGEIHYEIACLHGAGSIPDALKSSSVESGEAGKGDCVLDTHDVVSCLFHLCCAASLWNVRACMALGRVYAGMSSSVSSLLNWIMSVNYEKSKIFLRRAMESKYPPTSVRCAAGCLLLQIMNKQTNHTESEIISMTEHVVDLFDAKEKEETEILVERKTLERGGKFHPGDRVMTSSSNSKSVHDGVITGVSDEGSNLHVHFDEEKLEEEHVIDLNHSSICLDVLEDFSARSDSYSYSGNCDEEICCEKSYRLKARLAEYKAKENDVAAAFILFQEASQAAYDDGLIDAGDSWKKCAAALGRNN